MRRFARKTLAIKAAVAMTIAATLVGAGTVSASAASDSVLADGNISYSDWLWSATGQSQDQMRGTGFHYEGDGWSGISAQVRARYGTYGATLQRNLSWVDDGWVTVADTNSGNWVRDNKRYKLLCGDTIQYRVNSWYWAGNEEMATYSSKISKNC